jgi:hypothetical protein
MAKDTTGTIVHSCWLQYSSRVLGPSTYRLAGAVYTFGHRRSISRDSSKLLPVSARTLITLMKGAYYWIYCNRANDPFHHATFILLAPCFVITIIFGSLPITPEVVNLALITSESFFFVLHFVGFIGRGNMSNLPETESPYIVLWNIALSSAVLVCSISSLICYVRGNLEYTSSLWVSCTQALKARHS